jgi:hypothetical protein
MVKHLKRPGEKALFHLPRDLSDPPLDHDTILELGNLNRLLVFIEGAVGEGRANRVGAGEVLRSRSIILRGQEAANENKTTRTH